MAAAIRPYEPRDLAACRRLCEELTEWHRELFGDPSIGSETSDEPFDAHLAAVRPGCVWVAEDAGDVVGFAALARHGHKAELEPVVVTSRRRAQGIGRALAQAAVADARANGVRQVFVRPVARNAEALRFFHAVRFRSLARVELALDLTDGPVWRDGMDLAGRRFRM